MRIIFDLACWLLPLALTTACVRLPSSLDGPIPEYTRAQDLPQWSLTTASYNVWDIWPVAKYKDERRPAIGRAIRERDLDVVLIQEAWLEKGRDRIFKASAYPHRHAFTSPLSAGTGLYALAKAEISCPVFAQFILSGRLGEIFRGEALADKGVGKFTAVVGDLPVSFFNTHTIARHDDRLAPTHRTTPARLMQLFQVFAHVVEQTESDAFVVAGDFNTSFGQSEYAFFKKLTSLEGTTLQESDPLACTSCPDNVFQDHSDQNFPQLIDLVWVSPRLRVVDAHVDFREQVVAADGSSIHLSDHFGMTARLAAVSGASGKDPEQVRRGIWESLTELEAQLQQYRAGPGEEEEAKVLGVQGIQDRLCHRCNIKDSLKRVALYQEALVEPRSEEARILRARLESYVGLFR